MTFMPSAFIAFRAAALFMGSAWRSLALWPDRLCRLTDPAVGAKGPAHSGLGAAPCCLAAAGAPGFRAAARAKR